jgi:aminopeptidase
MVDKLAALICDYSLSVTRDKIGLIRGEMCAAPLIRACYRAVLKRGAHPVLKISYPEQNADFFKYGSEHQFKFVSPMDKLQAETVDAQITIDSTDNAMELTGADPKSVAAAQKVKGDLREVMFDRELNGKFEWIIAPFPTPSMAQAAEMSFEDYSSFVYSACKLDTPNPVEAWQAVGLAQSTAAAKLAGGKTVHIKGPGTDLKLSVEGRIWKSSCGKRNMPDGEIFTSPVENSAEGEIYLGVPTNYNGVEAEGVRLRFKEGKVIYAAAEKGEEYLLKMLDTDDGARFVGEIAFGTNENITRTTKNILFDEKMGKTMHLAVGASYKETGGKNISALHWDLITDMKQSYVELDGKLIYKNGSFV